VKTAIHAPLNVNWEECVPQTDVFPNGDASDWPVFTVLPNVIEKSNRTVIVHGLADYYVIAEGYALLFSLCLARLISFRPILGQGSPFKSEDPMGYQVQNDLRTSIISLTWAGKQGFQTPIASESFVVDGVGAFGTSHVERGLAYVEVVLSGHMCEMSSFGLSNSYFNFPRVPQFSPVAAFQTMQYLMGFRPNI